jgi:membrane protein
MNISSKRFQSAMNLGGLTFHEAAVRSWTRIKEDAILTRAAAITFYAFAALVPFLALLIALTVHWLPWIARQMRGEPISDLSEPLEELLPADAASLVTRELMRLRAQPPSGLISFGVAAVLWLSSSVFVEIIDAMNFILGVTETRSFWKRRAMAIVMTLSQAAILIAAVVTIVAWPQIVDLLNLSEGAAILATGLHWITVFFTVLLSFALALYVAPDADQHWEWITPGSLLGTVVLLAFSICFRIYTQYWANYSATYGSLAGIIILLSWLWLSAIVLLTAAELNKVIKDASPFGKRVEREHERAHMNALDSTASICISQCNPTCSECFGIQFARMRKQVNH